MAPKQEDHQNQTDSELDVVDEIDDDAYDPFDDGDEQDDDLEFDRETVPSAYGQAMRDARLEQRERRHDDRTAYERVCDLLEQANDQRPTLLATLVHCLEQRPVHEVNDMLDDRLARNPSVYSPANICSLLERAGGLELVTEEGAPFSEADEGEARVVVVDGVEYLEPGQAPQTFWRTTDAGRQAVEDDDPRGRLMGLLEDEPDVQELYLRVLLMCAREQGATARDLASVVDRDPLAQNPVLTAPHFSIALRNCGALEWSGAWHVTELGRRIMLEVFGVTDESLAAEIADVESHAVPVEAGAPDDEDVFPYVGD